MLQIPVFLTVCNNISMKNVKSVKCAEILKIVGILISFNATLLATVYRNY